MRPDFTKRINRYWADWHNTGKDHNPPITLEEYVQYRVAIAPVLTELTKLSVASPDTAFNYSISPAYTPALYVWWTGGPSIAQVKSRFEKFDRPDPRWYGSFCRYQSQTGIDSWFFIAGKPPADAGRKMRAAMRILADQREPLTVN